MAGSTRLEDEGCPVASRIRAEVEGPLDLRAIRESHRAAAFSQGGSTLEEDMGCPTALRCRLESEELLRAASAAQGNGGQKLAL